MRKWRDRERTMAPSSQKFTQGGILIRDWFSDRLEAGGEATLEKKHKICNYCIHRQLLDPKHGLQDNYYDADV
jgi:hypothetical protein